MAGQRVLGGGLGSGDSAAPAASLPGKRRQAPSKPKGDLLRQHGGGIRAYFAGGGSGGGRTLGACSSSAPSPPPRIGSPDVADEAEALAVAEGETQVLPNEAPSPLRGAGAAVAARPEAETAATQPEAAAAVAAAAADLESQLGAATDGIDGSIEVECNSFPGPTQMWAWSPTSPAAGRSTDTLGCTPMRRKRSRGDHEERAGSPEVHVEPPQCPCTEPGVAVASSSSGAGVERSVGKYMIASAAPGTRIFWEQWMPNGRTASGDAPLQPEPLPGAPVAPTSPPRRRQGSRSRSRSRSPGSPFFPGPTQMWGGLRKSISLDLTAQSPEATRAAPKAAGEERERSVSPTVSFHLPSPTAACSGDGVADGVGDGDGSGGP
mmetsp:Transcript_144745/g.463867  ORF Transcript_144745/g.463867 Transcript_144745/m.463867 type:complete len:378 (-) Transcript_144745:182-1315(-)